MNSAEQAMDETNARLNLTRYYKEREYSAPYKPPSSELFAIEYKGFLVTKDSSEYLLWGIKTLEGGKPPIPLRSSFTTKDKAMIHIDTFWLTEENKKTNEQNSNSNPI